MPATCWSHTHWSEESHNSNCPWCFLEAPTASWSRLVDGDVSDRFFDRLSGGSTVSNFFGARFKAWWKIHSSPMVAVCFPSSENAGVFGGAVGSRVSSCTARSPVGASTKVTGRT